MQVVLQIAFIVLWITGLILLVIGIWYGFSFVVLAAISKLLPLTGCRTRTHRPDEQS